MDKTIRVEQVNALLPQTQCERCGYPGCKPYAEAIVKDQAHINLCVPGQNETAKALAELTHKPFAEVVERPPSAHQTTAIIDEQSCIGCTKCIQACPVDAIIGSSKKMHTVISDYCTGCDLCVPVCPVDCIEMVVVEPHEPTHIIHASEEKLSKAQAAKTRFEQRQQRLSKQQSEKKEKYQQIVKQRNIKSQISDILARNKDKAPTIQV